MLRAILWDNDGVLVDTEGLYFQASREALERLGIRLSEVHFIERFLKASEGLARIAAEHGIDEQTLEPSRIWRNARYTELLRAGVHVIDGAHQVLRQLHGTVRMGIAPVRGGSTLRSSTLTRVCWTGSISRSCAKTTGIPSPTPSPTSRLCGKTASAPTNASLSKTRTGGCAPHWRPGCAASSYRRA